MNLYHKNLKKLENIPRVLFEGFHCDYNEITSLKGSPKVVMGYFVCFHNRLTSILYCPKEMILLLYSGNHLLTLDYVPSNRKI